jgi:hypothetical protein
MVCISEIACYIALFLPKKLFSDCRGDELQSVGSSSKLRKDTTNANTDGSE